MELSIVTTLYHSAPYIEEFYNRINAEAEKITKKYELIFVNDGSPDDSLGIALSLQKKDARVVIVDLSRNFGHHKAIMTGLSHAQGEKVFLLDSDLEEEPELIGPFHKIFSEEACDVVYGVQKKRKGDFFERISGNIFYDILNFISYTRMHRNVITARLMSKRYVKSLLLHTERELFLAGLLHITGYVQIPYYVTKYSKRTTSYTFRKKVALMINAITSFTDRPLVYIFYTGVIISFLAASYMFLILVRKLFFKITVSGWTSLIVSIWFLGGLTIFFMGIIGIYLSKIFIETKKRPYTIVRTVYRRTENGEK